MRKILIANSIININFPDVSYFQKSGSLIFFYPVLTFLLAIFFHGHLTKKKKERKSPIYCRDF